VTDTLDPVNKQVLMQLVRGFAMGAADVVPGVSGGTVALVFGIYRRLIANVRKGASTLGRLVKLDVKGALTEFMGIEWLFILPLGAGMASAFLILRHPVEDLLVERPELIAGVFFGLVAASVVLAWRDLGRLSGEQLGILAAVAVVAFFALSAAAGTVKDPTLPLFIGAGAIAITAMILPGISGSFILLMLGMYAHVLGGSIIELGAVLIGAVFGLAVFSTLLNWLLDRHDKTVIAALIGLMIGSFRVLWPWPNGVGYISKEEGESVSGTGLGLPDTLGDAVGPIFGAVVAAGLVLGIAALAERRRPPTAIADNGVAITEQA